MAKPEYKRTECPLVCPKCGYEDIETVSKEWYDTDFVATMHCPACKAEWYEVYSFEYWEYDVPASTKSQERVI